MALSCQCEGLKLSTEFHCALCCKWALQMFLTHGVLLSSSIIPCFAGMRCPGTRSRETPSGPLWVSHWLTLNRGPENHRDFIPDGPCSDAAVYYFCFVVFAVLRYLRLLPLSSLKLCSKSFGGKKAPLLHHQFSWITLYWNPCFPWIIIHSGCYRFSVTVWDFPNAFGAEVCERKIPSLNEHQLTIWFFAVSWMKCLCV